MKTTAQFSGVNSPLSVELMLIVLCSCVLDPRGEHDRSRPCVLLPVWMNFLLCERTTCVSSFRTRLSAIHSFPAAAAAFCEGIAGFLTHHEPSTRLEIFCPVSAPRPGEVPTRAELNHAGSLW